MAGLFATPDQIRAAQLAQQKQQFLQGGAVNAAAFGAGNAAGGAGSRGLFNVDTRSPAELRSQQLQQVMQRINLSDPRSVQQGLNLLNQSGFQNEALEIAKLIPNPVKPGKRFGNIESELLQVTDDTGNITFKLNRFQTDLDTNERALKGSVTSSGDAAIGSLDLGADTPLPARLKKSIVMTPTVAITKMRQLHNAPEFSGIINDTEFDELVDQGVEGIILSKAEALKAQDRERVAVLPRTNPGLTLSEYQALGSKDDTHYINQAFAEFMNTGAYKSFLDDNGEGGGIGSNIDIPISDTLTQKDEELRRARGTARAATIQRLGNGGELVVGDPRLGEFSIRGLREPQKALVKETFVDGLRQLANGQLDPQSLAQFYQDNGIKFNPKSLDSHMRRWQEMSEPSIRPHVARLLPMLESSNEFSRVSLQYTDTLAEVGDAVAWARAMQIRGYLEELVGKNTEPKAKIKAGRKVR